MNDYKEKLRKLQHIYIVGLSLITAIIAIINIYHPSYYNDNIHISNTVHAMQAGMLIMLLIVIVVYIIRNNNALNNEEKLHCMMNKCLEEQTAKKEVIIIYRIIQILVFCLALAVILSGYFDEVLFYRLMQNLVFVGLIGLIVKFVFFRSKKREQSNN